VSLRLLLLPILIAAASGCTGIQPNTAHCIAVPTRAGPEDLLLLQGPAGEGWLVTGTADRGLWPWRRKTAYIELIPLGPSGAPMAEAAIRHPLRPPEDFRPLGLAATAGDTPGTYRLHVLSDRGTPRVERFRLSLPSGSLRHLKAHSEEIATEDAPGPVRTANAIEAFADGRAIVSAPRMFALTAATDVWVTRDAAGRWHDAGIPGTFANGVRRLGGGVVLADYRRKQLLYARLTGNGLTVVDSTRIDDHPDNIARSPAGHLTVATHRSLLLASLHLLLGDWVPVDSAAYRITLDGELLRVTPSAQPMPKGSAAVSTAIETQDWWYFSQIRRPTLYACPKARERQ
jgi:hypothetical protein